MVFLKMFVHTYQMNLEDAHRLYIKIYIFLYLYYKIDPVHNISYILCHCISNSLKH